MRFNRRRSRRSKNANEDSQEASGTAEAAPTQSQSNTATQEGGDDLGQPISSAELLEETQNPNRLVSDWLERSVQENPENLQSRYGQSVQEMSTHFAHKAIRNQEEDDNRRKSCPNEDRNKMRKASKVISLILGEGPSTSTLPKRESEVSAPEQEREAVNQIKEQVDLSKVSKEELRKLAESVEHLGETSKASAPGLNEDKIIPNTLTEEATTERDIQQTGTTSIQTRTSIQEATKESKKSENISKASLEEDSSGDQMIVKTVFSSKEMTEATESEQQERHSQITGEKRSVPSLKKFDSRSSAVSSMPGPGRFAGPDKNNSSTGEKDFYGNSSNDEEIEATDSPPVNASNNEASGSSSPIPDVTRSLENMEPLTSRPESLKNSSIEKAATSKLSFQEIIAKTSTEELRRVLSQASKKTSRSDIIQQLASSTNFSSRDAIDERTSNHSKDDQISVRSLSKKSSSIPPHDRTFLEDKSVSSHSSKIVQEDDLKSTSSRRLSKAESIASITHSSKASRRKSINSKVSNSLENSSTQNQIEATSIVASQTFLEEKASSRTQSVAENKSPADTPLDNASTRSSRQSQLREENQTSSEEESVPKKLVSQLLDEIQSGDEANDISFSETEEAKEREDLKETSSSKRRITRGKLRSFISQQEMSVKGESVKSQTSSTRRSSAEQLTELLSKASEVEITEDQPRSSNSIVNSVISDLLKLSKEKLSEVAVSEKLSKEEILDQKTESSPLLQTGGSSSKASGMEASSREQDFKVPPTPKPSRSSMNPDSVTRFDAPRKSVPESAIDVLRLIQKPEDLPSAPVNSKSSMNSERSSQGGESQMSVIDPETLRTRRKTVPESAIEVLKLIQQQKDLPSTPANSLNSQNSLLKSQDSGISQTSRRDSTQVERRKTIPESAIGVLLELQQPNSSKSSMKSDQASDPDLHKSNENERKSTPASASNSVQEVQDNRIPSSAKSEEHLMTDTDGEAFSDSEEGKLIQKTSSTGQRRITRGKLHSFIKSKELLATDSNVSAASTGSNTKKPSCLSNAQSIFSVRTSRKSEHQPDKALLDESAENEQIDDSTEDMSMDVDTANPSDVRTAPTALEIVRPSPSHSKASTNLLEEQSEMENLNSSHIQSKISFGSRSTKSEERLSSQHKASATSIVSESAIMNKDDDSSSLKFIENDVKESDDPHSTPSKISQISIEDPLATSSRIYYKSKVSEISHNSVKSQGSTTKSISEDIYDAFMKTIMRELMEDAHEEETCIPKKANSEISSAESSNSVKKSSSTASRISTRSRSSKLSKESIKSRRSSTRSKRSSHEENPQARTTSSIANSFVRHVLDDAQQNLREENHVNIEQEGCNDNDQHSLLNKTPSRVSTRSRLSKASNASSNKLCSSLRQESAAKSSQSLRQATSEINVINDNSSKVSTRSGSSNCSHQSRSSLQEESITKFSHSLQQQRSEIKEINGNSCSAASINDALDTEIEPNKVKETASRISTRSSTKSEKTTNSMSQSTAKPSKISTISENVSLREDVLKESAIDLNKPEESLSRITTRSSKVSEKSADDDHSFGSSRISTRSRSSSKKALSPKTSSTSKNERPRTRSSSRSSKASSAASKAASIHSKISTRSSSRLKGNPANSRESSLSLSDSKNSQLQTSFSKISKMSNDESSSVPHKTTSKSTFSSKSPTNSQVQLNAQDDSKSVQESAISSRHSKLPQTELAVNSKSTISDCNKSEGQVAFSDSPARITSNTTTSIPPDAVSTSHDHELIATEPIPSRSDSPTSSLLSEIDKLTSVSQRNLTAEKRQFSSGNNGSSSSSDSDQGDSIPEQKRSKLDLPKSDYSSDEMKLTGDIAESKRYKQDVAPLDLNHNDDCTSWLNKLDTTSLRDKTKELLKSNNYTREEVIRELDDPKSPFGKHLQIGEKAILRNQLNVSLSQKSTTIKDSVHGTIELHPLADALRKTPEFARMKYISQLGTVDYVYPCATGNRYIHSLGTYHLTRKMLEKIVANNPDAIKDANIDREKDLLIVQLAALLHDIGHGPWSHFWDGEMIPKNMRDIERVNPETGKVEKVHGLQHPYDPSSVITSWSHEDASKAIVKHIFETNEDVKAKWAEYGMQPIDLEFLIELIDPTPLKGLKDNAPWPMKGRPESHAFLYEIVSNKKGGIDTDRMDYLKRDTLICKGNDFDVEYERIFANIKINHCKTNLGRTLLCYHKKIADDCWNILLQRDKNHREIYQHKKALAAEQQLALALDLVKDTLRQKGSDKRWYTMCESIFDMTAYCKFTEDYVRSAISRPDERIETIQSSHPKTGELQERNNVIRKLVRAKEIMEDLDEQRIWLCVGRAKFETKDKATNFYFERESLVNKMCREIQNLEAIKEHPEVQVLPGHFHVSRGPTFNMGMKDKDPLEYLPIYEDGISDYSEGKGQSFFRTMNISSEYCISFFVETETYLNEAKMIFTRLMNEEKIKQDHISEDFTMTPDARRNKRPCSPSNFNDSGAPSTSRRKIDF